jgi:hypothetical protein
MNGNKRWKSVNGPSTAVAVPAFSIPMPAGTALSLPAGCRRNLEPTAGAPGR